MQRNGLLGTPGVFEVLKLKITASIRELLYRNVSEDKIRKAAEHGGMRTLLQEACTKLIQGETTIEEVTRVVSSDRFNGVPCGRCGATYGLRRLPALRSRQRFDMPLLQPRVRQGMEVLCLLSSSLEPGPRNIKKVVHDRIPKTPIARQIDAKRNRDEALAFERVFTKALN